MIAPVETISKLISPMICNNFVLRIKILLGSKDGNRTRKRFVSTFEYNSNSYKDVAKLTAMSIDTRDYLVFEEYISMEDRYVSNVKREAHKMHFSYDNIHQLSWALNTAYGWLTTSANDIYQRSKDGELVGLSPQFMNLAVTCESTHMTMYADPILRITPTIKLDPISKDKVPGVMVLMGGKNDQVGSLTLHEIAALIHFIDRFDLCSASLHLVNDLLAYTPLLMDAKPKK